MCLCRAGSVRPLIVASWLREWGCRLREYTISLRCLLANDENTESNSGGNVVVITLNLLVKYSVHGLRNAII